MVYNDDELPETDEEAAERAFDEDDIDDRMGTVKQAQY